MRGESASSSLENWWVEREGVGECLLRGGGEGEWFTRTVGGEDRCVEREERVEERI